jgi:NAD(P)-dependent dehydrogenase (short-subunit alcohol dehydrogenase family)
MATVLITGANKGIGLELSRQLTERGDLERLALSSKRWAFGCSKGWT